MSLKTIGIMSPGDMGHAVGRALGDNGFDVITCLEGRSERTRTLANQGNFRDVSSMEELVTQADLVMCILVPSQAEPVALRVADALKSTGQDTYYADCNAVSPQTSLRLASVINNAGGRFIDGGIIGGPPGGGEPPRFYVSGGATVGACRQRYPSSRICQSRHFSWRVLRRIFWRIMVRSRCQRQMI